MPQIGNIHQFLKITGCIYLVIQILSCLPVGNNTYEELEPGDLPASPTYELHVKPILEEKCLMCHSKNEGRASEGISYDNYIAVIPTSSRILGWGGIKSTAIIEKRMPPGGKERLTPKEVALLLRWEAQGFANK